jgi:hypothetical protein
MFAQNSEISNSYYLLIQHLFSQGHISEEAILGWADLSKDIIAHEGELAEDESDDEDFEMLVPKEKLIMFLKDVSTVGLC